MITNGKGGAKTARVGRQFEKDTDLRQQFARNGWTIKSETGVRKYVTSTGHKAQVKYNKEFAVNSEGKVVGRFVQKHGLINFLREQGIDYKTVWSKKNLPDEAFINFETMTIIVVEKKWQNGSGSVDEKIPGFDYKNWEYQRIVAPLGFKVKYCYLLCDWFQRPEYQDMHTYLKREKCDYFFGEVPMSYFGV